MLTRISAVAAAVVFASLIGLVSVASPDEAANSSAAKVTVPQSPLDALIGESNIHFHKAADLYEKGDAEGAASQIRAAAALIRLEAGRGSAEDDAKLRTTATDLGTLADNVVNGNVPSRRDLELAFARADLALAAHYRSLADKALAERNRPDAVRWLKASSNSVDEALAWTGQAPSSAQAQLSDQMHALQQKIHTSANWSFDEAKKGVGYLGTQIQYLGQEMQKFGGSGAKNGGEAP